MSTIKVDTIKKVNDSVPKASDLGLNVTGTVLQVINTKDDTDQGTTSTSYANSSTNVVITPSSTSSKVLLICTFTSQVSGGRGRFTFHSSAAGDTLHGAGEQSFASLESTNVNVPTSMHHLDSPNTTSAITYTVQFLNTGGNNTYITGNNPCILTAMEIAG